MIATNVELNGSDLLWAEFWRISEEENLTHRFDGSWPSSWSIVPDDALHSKRESDGDLSYLLRHKRTLIKVFLSGGSAHVNVAATCPDEAEAAIKWVETIQPRSEPPEAKVQVSFWSYGMQGPSRVIRSIAAPTWQEIEANYADEVAEKLAYMVGPDFEPGVGGQLLLFSGIAGSGKTTALRSIAREWKSWAKIAYITDPEKFFGSQADYMIHLLLNDDTTKDIFTIGDDDEPERGQWRLLVLEDCGEMLRKDASEVTGKALSRLLNTVDGLIGQGLRIMVLVTTNEDVGTLHDAVARPGRCAVEIKFDRLTAQRADEWREAHELEATGETASIAELYAELEGFRGADQRGKAMGFAV